MAEPFAMLLLECSNATMTGSVATLRWLTPAKVYGPVEFMASVMTMDVIGKPHGQRRLADHFRRCSKAVPHKTADKTRQSLGLTKNHP